MHSNLPLIKLLQEEYPELSFFAAIRYSDEARHLCQEAELALSPMPSLPLSRKNDFLLGRACLYHASLPVLGSGYWLPYAERPPYHPQMYFSISHCQGATVAVAGKKDKAAPSLGIDLETLSRQIRPGLLERICQGTEAEILRKAWNEKAPVDLLAFCAKEAVYKSLPPHLQHDLTISKIRIIPTKENSLFCHAQIHNSQRYTGMRVTLVQESGFILALACSQVQNVL
jgi:4'-phosphopantetheinyl transferase EntD